MGSAVFKVISIEMVEKRGGQPEVLCIRETAKNDIHIDNGCNFQQRMQNNANVQAVLEIQNTHPSGFATQIRKGKSK